MKRARKPKGKGGMLNRKQKDEITWFVIKKLFPRFAAILLTSVQYVMGADVKQINEIIDMCHRYTAMHDAGILNVEDLKDSLEKATGRKLEDVLGSGSEFGELLGKGGAK